VGYTTAILEPLTVAKNRRPASATVKIDAELLRKAKQHATLEDIKLQDYIDKLLRAPIERDHARTLRKLREGEPTDD
jgi:predicted DNA binding CopG/RHH family protein